VAPGRRADVDEIELFAGEKIIDRRMLPAFRTGRKKGLATRRGGVGRGDNPRVVASAPAGQVPVGGDIAEADERALQQGTSAQSRENRRAIAANDRSRISTPRNASSSVMTSGGLMRMTFE
jgi:hypothetical protein